MTVTKSTIRLTLAAAMFGVIASGCASLQVPFTNELRQEHNLSADDIESLQFYLSDEVKLRREVESGGRVISRGQLRLHKGKTIDEVVIEKETPGVAVALDEQSIRISFEEGSSLNFSLEVGQPSLLVPIHSESRFAEPPNPFPGEGFHQRPHREPTVSSGNYFLAIDPDGSLVTFRGKLFEAIDSSYRAHLMIDAEALEEVIENRTVLGGRTLGQFRPECEVCDDERLAF